MGRSGRGSLAGGDFEGAAQPSRIGASRPRRWARWRVAAIPTGRRTLAVSALETRSGSVSGRRHGAGQDNSGAFAAAGSQTSDGPPAATQLIGGASIAAGQLGGGNRT